MPIQDEFRQFLSGSKAPHGPISPDGQNNYESTVFSSTSQAFTTLKQLFHIPSGNRPIADLNTDELLELENLVSQYISSSKSTPLTLGRAQDIRSHIRAYIRCIEEKIISTRQQW